MSRRARSLKGIVMTVRTVADGSSKYKVSEEALGKISIKLHEIFRRCKDGDLPIDATLSVLQGVMDKKYIYPDGGTLGIDEGRLPSLIALRGLMVVAYYYNRGYVVLGNGRGGRAHFNSFGGQFHHEFATIRDFFEFAQFVGDLMNMRLCKHKGAPSLTNQPSPELWKFEFED